MISWLFGGICGLGAVSQGALFLHGCDWTHHLVAVKGDEVLNIGLALDLAGGAMVLHRGRTCTSATYDVLSCEKETLVLERRKNSPKGLASE